MSTCGTCGSATGADSRFCPVCGEYLGWRAPGTTASPSRSPEPSRAEQGHTREPATPPSAAPPSAPPTRAPVSPPRSPADPVGPVLERLGKVERLASGMERDDVVEHLARTRAGLESRSVTVAVIGEFKRGKSTLVNALLRADICPVDADVVTAVPTTIRYGVPPGATAFVEAEDHPDGVIAQDVPLSRLADVVGESFDGATRPAFREVEVRLDLRMLSGGLVVVDTPGVGGLESAHGEVTLAALASTDAMVFVTDASQELTGPEVGFLRQALQRCGQAVCVVTKTDLYPHWRRIADLNREHLARADLNLPVVAVSSFLRIRARSLTGQPRTRVNEESGFSHLYDWLAAQIGAAKGRRVEAATQDIDFAHQQLSTEVRAEHLVLTQPNRTPEIMRHLQEAAQRRQALAARGANWQQTLAFGIEKLVSDIQFDLAGRLKKLLREVETDIDETDPKDTWDLIGPWLQRKTVGIAAANHDLMREKAEALAREVAQTFSLQADTPIGLAPSEHVTVLDDIELRELDDSATHTGRLGRYVVAGRTAALIPMMTFGLAGHLVIASVVGPLAVAAAVWVAKSLFSDERKRQLLVRRQGAKNAVRGYIDDVQLVLNKDCRDALLVTREELVTEFQGRADLLQASSDRAVAAARRAAGMHPEEAAARVTAVERQQAVLTDAVAKRSGTVARGGVR